MESEGNAPLNGPGALGASPNTIKIGALASPGDLRVRINTAGVLVGKSFTVSDDNLIGTPSKTIMGGSHTNGTSVFSGGVSMARSVHLQALGQSTVEFNGAFDDWTSAAITKIGSGTVKLGGNIVSGTPGPCPIAIEAGTLLANADAGASAIWVADGATLGGGVTTGRVTIVSGGTVAPGQSAGTLTVGSLSLVDNSILDSDLDSPLTSDMLIITGTDPGSLVFSGTGTAILDFADLGGLDIGTYTLIDYAQAPIAGLGGFFAIATPTMGDLSLLLVHNVGNTSLDLVVQPVPEPASVALLAMVGCTLAARRRRK